MTGDLPFEPEIAAAAFAIQRTVAAGENDPLRHAWQIANAVEQMMERYFPDLTTATAIDLRATVAGLLELYAAIHEDTATPGAGVHVPIVDLS